jgi:diketogulonate reductase-like aldo/keto reductase
MINRTIPSTNEQLPVCGIGTWQTFDVNIQGPPASLKEVLQTMQNAGGTLIDSSPMYGKSEEVVGELTHGAPWENYFFYATKVWTTGKEEGIRQMESSLLKMKRKSMDLIQIHNLTDWKTQLKTLRAWKETGKTRYIGITHYTDSMHEELERILKAEKVDFVQFNYSILARNAEKRLLDVAADLGVATLINRPLDVGALFKKVKGKPLPPWAIELDMDSWSVFFLKYIIAHPAVTCIIPATGNPLHAADNSKAGKGSLPDLVTRKQMVDYLSAL